MENRDLVIVGGGPAGMAAAISAYKNGVRDILLIERDQFLGGILNQCVHTGFGVDHFKEVLTGPEYAHRFIEELRSIPDIEVSLKTFVVKLTGSKTITYMRPGALDKVKARSVIMATGCRERTREMIHIPGTRPAGIFSAGLAQKLINIEGFLPGKRVVIVGSGDIGLIMARRMVLEGAEVRGVVEIERKTMGLTRNVVQCIDDFGIPIYFNHKVSNIFGRDRVEAIEIIKIDDEYNDIMGTKTRIECDTLLVSVGLVPENEMIEMAGVKIDKTTNSPVTKEINKTSVPGIFVCGNSFRVYDIVDNVTKDSELAGKQAAEYLKDLS